jgi:hypothetical protein
MSYDGQLNYGLIGDYDAMADIETLADELTGAFEELLDAAGADRGPRPRLAAVPAPSRVTAPE